jgi:hypothetical protein
MGVLADVYSTINSGRFVAALRLLKLIAVELVVYKPRLTVPFPLTRDVISTVVQVPAVMRPEEPTELPIVGALL